MIVRTSNLRWACTHFEQLLRGRPNLATQRSDQDTVWKVAQRHVPSLPWWLCQNSGLAGMSRSAVAPFPPPSSVASTSLTVTGSAAADLQFPWELDNVDYLRRVVAHADTALRTVRPPTFWPQTAYRPPEHACLLRFSKSYPAVLDCSNFPQPFCLRISCQGRKPEYICHRPLPRCYSSSSNKAADCHASPLPSRDSPFGACTGPANSRIYR